MDGNLRVDTDIAFAFASASAAAFATVAAPAAFVPEPGLGMEARELSSSFPETCSEAGGVKGARELSSTLCNGGA